MNIMKISREELFEINLALSDWIITLAKGRSHERLHTVNLLWRDLNNLYEKLDEKKYLNIEIKEL